MSTDEQYMSRAIALALKGRGTTSPNPMVGAVIVKDGNILGEGYHEFCGGPHAEINAINSVIDSESLHDATIYVTLEPCSTYGRTPPCCEAIIRNGFARVVIGCIDPNPAHAGEGVAILEEAGIEVSTGILEDECRMINEAFFKWIVTKRPFVTLKMAQTLDGKTATVNGVSKWITSVEARKHVHELRLEADAVMCGRGTFDADNPSLTARDIDGNVIKTPRRIVVTDHPETLNLGENWETVSLPDSESWDKFLERLGNEDVVSLLIEGGSVLAASALNAGTVDKVEFHIAPKILGGEHSRPSVAGGDPRTMDDALEVENMRIRQYGCDFVASGYVVKRNRKF